MVTYRIKNSDYLNLVRENPGGEVAASGQTKNSCLHGSKEGHDC